jgi:nucleoid-associated protein YgaU
MTKETKIGLLVGLAFIILFAIILSEKGATRGTKAPSSFSMADDASKGDQAPGQERPLEGAGSLPVEGQLPPDAGGDAASLAGGATRHGPTGQAVPAEGEALAPLPEPLVEFLNQPVDGSELAEAMPTSEEGDGAVTVEEAVARALADDKPAPAPGVGESEAAGPAHATASHLADAGASRSGASAAKKATEPPAIMAEHVVQAGESLGKIAAKYYGRATPARIEAIFNANRDVLKTVHRVRADDTLKIPILETAETMFEPAPDFVVAQIASMQSPRQDGQVRIPVPVGEGEVGIDVPAGGSVDDAPAAPAFRWYEIQKRDTLSRIAKRELGNEKRFIEVYRMNRDLIGDKDRIRPGMKIRLPITTEADADAVSGRRTVASSHESY